MDYPMIVRRRFTDKPPSEPFADLTVNIRIDGWFGHSVPIQYDVCQEILPGVSRVISPWSPQQINPPSGPGQPDGPNPPYGPIAITVEGGFSRAAGAPLSAEQRSGRGPLDNVRYSYTYGGMESFGNTPRPDDTGPAPQAGGLLCRTVTSFRTDQQEHWLHAEAQVSFPVRLGITEQQLNLSSPDVLPKMEYRIDLRNLRAENLVLQIQANGPLAGLDTDGNRAWIRKLILDQVLRSFAPWQLVYESDLGYTYGTSNAAPPIPTLYPESLLPSVDLILDRFSSPSVAQSGALVLKFKLSDNFLSKI
jgi:hypothetical protein